MRWNDSTQSRLDFASEINEKASGGWAADLSQIK
jgi:hypothetical protein